MLWYAHPKLSGGMMTNPVFKILTAQKLCSRTAASLIGVFLGLAIWITGCTTAEKKDANPFATTAPSNRISLMSYNVENFFDNIHDENRVDFTFLPLSEKRTSKEAQNYCASQSGYRKVECQELNWDEAAVQKKIRHISSGILQVYGKGPDMLILVEVENLRILKRLNEEGLKAAGYQTVVLIEGDDMRGIDVGFLSRFPLAGEPKLHHVVYSPPKDPSRVPYGTRGILQVPVKLPSGKVLNVFGLHFPSQGNPHQERQDAMNALLKAIRELPPGAAWAIGGDWNIIYHENRETGIFDNNISSIGGLVSHKIGCKSCKGTHNFKGVWDFLDILVFSPNLADANATGYKVDPESIQTPHYSPLQLDRSGRPNRWDLKSDVGISDHLPIYAEFVEEKSTK